MALTPLVLDFDACSPIPEAVERFLADAERRIEAFIELHRDDPAAGFVPSDYKAVYGALIQLVEGRGGANGAFLPGNAFCEWGSGLGVVASLAAMVGFDSIGIEIDPRLVQASQSLAADHQVHVQLVRGSYVPDGHRVEEDFDESHVMTLEHGRAAYEELGLDPDDFDCIFAYPWPGEDDVVTSIFDAYAARGAVLLTFHGQDGLMARRKVR